MTISKYEQDKDKDHFERVIARLRHEVMLLKSETEVQVKSYEEKQTQAVAVDVCSVSC